MDYKVKIEEARKYGYSDKDIVNYLAHSDDKVKTALSHGYEPKEIVNFLMGQNNSAKPTTQDTSSKPTTQDTGSGQDSIKPIDISNMVNQDSSNTLTIDTKEPTQTSSLDTQTTMTQEQMKTSEANKDNIVKDTVYSAKQEATGAMSTFAGIYKTGLDMLALVPGLNNTETLQQAQQGASDAINYWNNLSDKLAKKEGYSKEGFFEPNNLGRMVPLFIAPTQTPLSTAVVLNGALAYAEARGEGKKATDSLIDGALAGGITYGTLKVFNYLATPTADKVYTELKEKLNISDDAANAIHKEYKAVMEDDGTNGKVKSLLWYAGKNKLNIGTKYITGISRDSMKAASNMEHEIMDRKNLLKSLVRTKYDSIDKFAADMKNVELSIKDDYSKIQSRIGNIKVNNATSRFTDDIPVSGPEWEGLSDLLKSDMYKIKELTTKEEVSLGDLTEVYKSVNKLLNSNSIKGTSKSHVLNNLKGEIDKGLAKHMPKEDYKLWKNINQDYSKYLTYKKSKLGQLIDSTIGNNPKTGTMSVDSILQKLPNLTESVDTFRAIRDLVGTEKASKLENYIIDTTLNKVDDFNYGRLKNMIGRKGFVSENANTLFNLTDKFEKAFKVDNLYTKALADLELKEGSKTTVSDMFKALGVKQVAKMLTKALPGEFGKEVRFTSRLTKILEKPSRVRQLEEAIDSMSIEGRKKILNDTVKLLEYRPDPVTKIVDNSRSYVTSEGTVIPQMTKNTESTVSKTVLKEGQDKLISDFIENSFKGQNRNVIDKASEILQDAKISETLKQAREKIGKDYQTKWSEVYNKSVKLKVDKIARNIESDLGIKIPKDQLANIYKREWKKDIVLNSPRYDNLKVNMTKLAGKDNVKAMGSLVDNLTREAKALSKKLDLPEDEAFKILLNKMKGECK